MKMEVLAVQKEYQPQLGMRGSSGKMQDWSSTLTPPPSAAVGVAAVGQQRSANSTPIRSSSRKSINSVSGSGISSKSAEFSVTGTGTAAATTTTAYASNSPSYDFSSTPYLFNCDRIDTATVNDVSLRLLEELRAAKSRHLVCTEVSIPCDLTPRIAAEIIRVSEKEPCGIRGCTIYIEFEDVTNNSRRIGSLKLSPETVSTFEVYLTLRQDQRGWSALLPQFMKNLGRHTITISPEFNITKHKLYSPHGECGESGTGSGGSGGLTISASTC